MWQVRRNPCRCLCAGSGWVPGTGLRTRVELDVDSDSAAGVQLIAPLEIHPSACKAEPPWDRLVVRSHCSIGLICSHSRDRLSNRRSRARTMSAPRLLGKRTGIRLPGAARRLAAVLCERWLVQRGASGERASCWEASVRSPTGSRNASVGCSLRLPVQSPNGFRLASDGEAMDALQAAWGGATFSLQPATAAAIDVLIAYCLQLLLLVHLLLLKMTLAAADDDAHCYCHNNLLTATPTATCLLGCCLLLRVVAVGVRYFDTSPW